MEPKPTSSSLWTRAGLVLFVLLGSVGVGYAVYWYVWMPVQDVTVRGAYFADEEALLQLAALDTSHSIGRQPVALIENRLERHPWVAVAVVKRLPHGVLSLRVEERTPVALALNSEGMPTFYLDPQGFALPYLPAARFDVPLVHGASAPSHPTRPIASGALKRLLRVLPELPPEEHALLSDFILNSNGEITLRTVSLPQQPSLRVYLGTEHYAQRLHLLYAFWMQAVLSRPGHQYDFVDLRYRSQIVTRERATPSDSSLSS